ncbi:hypothetical protein [Streptomyces sp. NPDC091219]|uniref:hypothetical protein n=1 Tax=Streptomyces sp. NPDC091219 TaxID=3155193 RepID=UPI00344D6CE9
MTNLDSVAHGLVDQFFTQGLPVVTQPHTRWTQAQELDRVTVSQLRLWAANRVLDTLARHSGAATTRDTALRERELLITWLESNGYQALA